MTAATSVAAPASAATQVWRPGDAFATVTNTAPWTFAQGSGFDATTYRPLTTYTTGNCGIAGLQALSDPAGLPSAGYNSNNHVVAGAGTCSSPFSIPAHGLTVHPMANDAIVMWTAPGDQPVSITGLISDADKSCGNGIDWRLALLPAGAGSAYWELARGGFDNGGTASPITGRSVTSIPAEKGDRIVLNVSSGGNPDCDLTNVALTITPVSVPGYAYVAMGDSYSSGEGSPENTFFSDTKRPDQKSGGTTGCHRSSVGWPTTIAAAKRLSGAQWKFAACSGARAIDFYQTNGSNPAERAQMLWLSRTTKLVTYTIGGNDVGFADILKDCVGDPIHYTPGGFGCSTPGRKGHDTAEAGLTKLTAGMRISPTGTTRTLADVYADTARRISPTGKVIVAGYPRLFALGGSCQVGVAQKLGGTARIPLSVNAADVAYLNNVLVRGNKIIAGAVSAANATLAREGRKIRVVPATKVATEFNAHSLCGKNAEYLNGAVLNGTHTTPDQRSFHPNKYGQSAYAKAVKAAL
ncbi:hypothetical protein ADL15_03870 [Actinoplanes awajinensis subsp. mycoplanecinus]|uniref:SGNH hydrolase-type esterase domain-containing protein n=1 Tax=Actinoplanes awajinensis subsp. mycoplanecinus TaxID=135947 RepID=A0A0X3VAE2_9ACTN|nr:hypothetical protein ADL15_03870 [Actinoplanes awajinensis subsp. mycoplanecinus]